MKISVNYYTETAVMELTEGNHVFRVSFDTITTTTTYIPILIYTHSQSLSHTHTLTHTHIVVIFHPVTNHLSGGTQMPCTA